MGRRSRSLLIAETCKDRESSIYIRRRRVLVGKGVMRIVDVSVIGKLIVKE